MSKKTIYTCDKCESEQETPEQFWDLSVRAKCLSIQYSEFDTGNNVKSFQVCRKCLESLGIYAKKVVPPAIPPAYPTIEELIKEIVQRTVDERH